MADLAHVWPARRPSRGGQLPGRRGHPGAARSRAAPADRRGRAGPDAGPRGVAPGLAGPRDRLSAAGGNGRGRHPRPPARRAGRRGNRGTAAVPAAGDPAHGRPVRGQGRLAAGSGQQGTGRHGGARPGPAARGERRRGGDPAVRGPRHREVDRGDVPDVPAAAAGRVADRGSGHPQGVRAGLGDTDADGQAAGSARRRLPALPFGPGLVLLASGRLYAGAADSALTR